MLLKYPGGKHNSARQILRYAPPDFGEFRSPMCGNCPYLWQTDYLPQHIPRWVNDLEVYVYRYWLALRDDPGFIDESMGLRNDAIVSARRTRQVFGSCRVRARRDFHMPSFLIVKRLAQRQVTGTHRRDFASFGGRNLVHRSGLKPLTRPKMERAWDIVQGVEITNLDFAEVMTAPPQTSQPVFIECDPPYRTTNGINAIYTHDFEEQDHTRFFNVVVSLDPKVYKVLVTIDRSLATWNQWWDNEYVRRKRLHVYERCDLPCGMSANAERKRKHELVIVNYLPDGSSI